MKEEAVEKLALSRNTLLQKEELEKVKVDLGKGEFVYVRQMTGRERDLFERSLYVFDKDNKITTRLADFRAKLAVVTVCDEEGKAVFFPEDYELLSKNMSAAKLEKIVNAAQKLNAITEEDKEGLLKNLEVGQADNSNSGSVEK
jgi:hypothetical protein